MKEIPKLAKGKKQVRGPKKNSIYQSFLRAVVIIFSLTLIFAFLYQGQEKPQRIGIADLAAKIEAREVSSVVVNGNVLEVTLKDGQALVSQKESEIGVTQTLNNYGVSPEALSSISLEVRDESGFAFWARILIPTLLPLLIIGFLFWILMKQARGGVNQAFTFGRANMHLFTNFKDKVTFKDVAGLKEAKKELEEVVDFLKSPKKYADMGAKVPRGVLLMGPPGTGKTLLARAVAGEAGVPFFHISASEFVEMFVGVGASRTRDAFNTAKKAAPSIIFIDEIDAVGRERGTGLGGGHDEREQTLNQILVEMDGFNKDTRVIVLAATNRPDVLDTALLRPGRFDRRVLLDLPDIKEREDILKIHSRGKKINDKVDYRRVASLTPGFSGADLESIVNEAAILAVQHSKKEVEQQDVLDSIEKVLLGPARKSLLISDKERKITAYHEAGHALVAAGLKDSDPVSKVSIVARGQAGGYTLNLPLEDRRLKSRSQFLADLAMMMGGYVSEKIIFNDITTGASSDLKKASDLSRLLVMRYGMSEKFGPLAFGKSSEMIFLGKDMITEKDYSEGVAAEIDEEIKKFVNDAYKKAFSIIKSNKNVLKAIAEALMEKEVLEHDEFYKIIKPFGLKPISA
ncbi:MAG: cell division protein FtsH [Candidatus Colwellbacteria bacterium RIFCSPHIGHO2_02_FULL_45_17]|uniref:ATP-dependent zinc metalloprotease FtsH n=1 Tax=Candidatus Colwellbacteria bacterium RIFCSPLOWO2_02_FULL_45_11 TaxID=1797692 RepID=A0A1G1Z9C9_9BACT|nr:MAG: cell division protein FtsH [Candidatus Colwellbacteria bacterium RIFCSPHIGHO2_02_FULL_45_17]OGY61252.1 MAG: cell division protein FtsH [Candidatus Colwellbacteria bacterium RIFCSPLOWO2_02_FULL_45_11]